MTWRYIIANSTGTMRLSPLLLTTQYYINGVRPKNGRRSTRQPFPYNNTLPLTLRDHVSGKGDKSQTVACVQELTVMLTCFKKNEFNESLCRSEIDALRKCNQDYMDSQRLKKEQDKGAELTPHAKSLSHKHLNILLKKHPQPK